MDRSLAFYADLGFEPALDWTDPAGSPRICHLKLGDAFLELFWFAGHQPPPDSAARLATDLPRIGSKHFALQVSSIEEAKAFVEEKGWGKVTIVDGRTGVRYFFLADPDGILLEFVEDRRGH
jgi:glyoxylase I family protein